MEITWANLFVFFLSRNINNKCNYYSFKIFPRFWLAYIPRIIHNDQLLSMTSIVQQNCQIIEQVNRENLGTRLGYFSSEHKMAEQSFHSFHEEEIRELLTKNQGSKLTHTNSQNANDFDNLRVKKISTNKRLRVRIIHVSQTFGESRRRNVQTTCETNKTADERWSEKSTFFVSHWREVLHRSPVPHMRMRVLLLLFLVVFITSVKNKFFLQEALRTLDL